MLWCSLPELSLVLGLILIILYGLFSMNFCAASHGMDMGNQIYVKKNNVFSSLVNLNLSDLYFFSRLWPIMLLLGYAIDYPFSSQNFLPTSTNLGDISNTDFFNTSVTALAYPYNNGIDIILIILTVVIMRSFRSFESVLLLLLAFIGQIFMLHSCDLVSFYICLEVQNFCFLVLCGLQPRVLKYNVSSQNNTSLMGNPTSKNLGLNLHQVGILPTKFLGSRPLAGVEASIKYLLLSAFSSGVLLFWFSALYLRTGITTLSWGPLTSNIFMGSAQNLREDLHLSFTTIFYA